MLISARFTSEVESGMLFKHKSAQFFNDINLLELGGLSIRSLDRCSLPTYSNLNSKRMKTGAVKLSKTFENPSVKYKVWNAQYSKWTVKRHTKNQLSEGTLLLSSIKQI